MTKPHTTKYQRKELAEIIENAGGDTNPSSLPHHFNYLINADILQRSGEGIATRYYLNQKITEVEKSILKAVPNIFSIITKNNETEKFKGYFKWKDLYKTLTEHPNTFNHLMIHEEQVIKSTMEQILLNKFRVDWSGFEGYTWNKKILFEQRICNQCWMPISSSKAYVLLEFSHEQIFVPWADSFSKEIGVELVFNSSADKTLPGATFTYHNHFSTANPINVWIGQLSEEKERFKRMKIEAMKKLNRPAEFWKSFKVHTVQRCYREIQIIHQTCYNNKSDLITAHELYHIMDKKSFKQVIKAHDIGNCTNCNLPSKSLKQYNRRNYKNHWS